MKGFKLFLEDLSSSEKLMIGEKAAFAAVSYAIENKESVLKEFGTWYAERYDEPFNPIDWKLADIFQREVANICQRLGISPDSSEFENAFNSLKLVANYARSALEAKVYDDLNLDNFKSQLSSTMGSVPVRAIDSQGVLKSPYDDDL